MITGIYEHQIIATQYVDNIQSIVPGVYIDDIITPSGNVSQVVLAENGQTGVLEHTYI